MPTRCGLIAIWVCLLCVHEPLDLRTVRHGVLRSPLGDDERPGGRCEPNSTLNGLSLCKSYCKRTCESVSCRYGIDRIDLNSRYVSYAIIVRVDDTLFAQFDN